MPADVNVALAVIVETVKMTPEEQKKQKLAADVPTVEIPQVCITSINTVNKRINLSISLLVSSIATLFFSLPQLISEFRQLSAKHHGVLFPL